ncbi:NADH-FMN oxidoreductase RutF, flavin reductase (DIM6/NTAB) family [Tistlia consotensis]|uniref:NADH-FMN oxidoreductase RutF, flavin reductase (DIM6/NTAB) family n=1 Tax=Tistlia consotensis USBA 355 TaxID=560819 RepID=A0A1Y6BZK3_9PROT|nr:flavin reductase [Tistlia consotensis]SMF36492.1 NADH-FMN oxidoreductase RutF, flavin reductase (DIM6/NTAB) family [Tistlia consotensis USBA 355]SNR71999.1 NADH-FMN oxidoreductase RutF, flavin reductase (DIM6/NTAB) family [Tistlia consotensis]
MPGEGNSAARSGAIEPQALRAALGNFVTGVTVVTLVDPEGRPRGLTVNSFTSVSLDPPLILVCIANSSSSLPLLETCGGFGVNVLSEDQRGVCDVFAKRSADRFAGLAWTAGATAAPRIDGSLVSLDCSVHARVPAGDHLILIGRIEDYAVLPGRPLVFGQGGYVPLGVQQAAVARPVGREVVVSCIAERAGRVLLERDGETWTLPRAALDQPAEKRPGAPGAAPGRDLGPLKRVFRELSVEVEITFLYSVFEGGEAGAAGDPGAAVPAVHIVYRGELRGGPPAGRQAQLFAEADVPWNALAPIQLKGMLRRFFRERTIDQFGVYSELADEGRVARLERAETFDSYLSRFGER